MNHKKQSEFIFKASWRSTAVTLKIQAKDEEEAEIKAIRMVKKMMGREMCLDLRLVNQHHSTIQKVITNNVKD